MCGWNDIFKITCRFYKKQVKKFGCKEGTVTHPTSIFQFRTSNKCVVDKIISRDQLHQFKFEVQSFRDRRPEKLFATHSGPKKESSALSLLIFMSLFLPFLIQRGLEDYRLFLCLPSPSAATHISMKIWQYILFHPYNFSRDAVFIWRSACWLVTNLFQQTREESRPGTALFILHPLSLLAHMSPWTPA